MSAETEMGELEGLIASAFPSAGRTLTTLEEIVQYPSGLSSRQRREAKKLIYKTCDDVDPTVFWLVEPWYLTTEAYKYFAPCFLLAFLEEDRATAPTKSSLCPEPTPRLLRWLFGGAIEERNRAWKEWLTEELIPSCNGEMLAVLARYVKYCLASPRAKESGCFERYWSQYG